MAKKEAYYEKILDWFKDQLITGALKEGDIVPSERDLAAQFGVSRVPVREALHILEFSGTISKTSGGMKIQVVNKQWVQPQVGFSPQMTQQSLEYLFEVRIFLESSAAQYAALRRTDEDIAQMRATIQKMLTAMNDPELREDFARDVVLLKYVGMNPIVVHGGGPDITEYMNRLDLPVQFVGGLRVTDAETARIAEMVLAGSINKEIVGWIGQAGGKAVGHAGRSARVADEIAPRNVEFVGKDEHHRLASNGAVDVPIRSTDPAENTSNACWLTQVSTMSASSRRSRNTTGTSRR